MSTLYKTIAVPAKPATEKTVECGLRCDLCGDESKSSWQSDSYDATEVEVLLTEGSRSPEGGDGTRTGFDICPTCFKEQLVPWMESRGAKPQFEKWNY